MQQPSVREDREAASPGPSVPSEAELLGRVARGDRGAFQALFGRYEAYVHWLARRLGGSAAEAEDVAQEVWLRVYARAGQFSGEVFRGWLRAIVIRCCLDHRRRRQARAADRTDPLGRDLPGAGDGTPLLRLHLEGALAALPEESRHVVVLHDIEGMGHAEIASRLGISEEASRTRLSRARRILRERLGGSLR